MNTIVRSFVLLLAFSGLAATASTPSASIKNGVSTNLASPMPLCAPSDPSYCGMH